MLVRSDLKLVAQKRLRDASVLLGKKRYSGAVYLAGYTIELYLKRRICQTWKFSRGFPETEAEFNAYKQAGKAAARVHLSIPKLQQIKCHDLNRLLFYSGQEDVIRNNFSNAWASVERWGPECRYSPLVVRKEAALTFLTSCKIIIENL